MAITFNSIPSGLRTPLFYLETDPSAAGSPAADVNPVLLAGGLLTAGSAAAGELHRVFGPSQAKALFGSGSILHEMVDAFRANDSFGELWCVGFADDGAGVASASTITFSGTATADGVYSLYIGGKLISTTVTSGDAHTAVSVAVDAEIAAEIADGAILSMTSGEAAGVVTLTARHKGATGEEIDIRENYLGTAGGEGAVPGISTAIASSATGATNPDLSGVGGLADVIADLPFDYVGIPYADAANLNEIDDVFDGVTGRWAYDRQIYGHCFTAKRDTVANLGTLGNTRNGPHLTILGLDPTPSNPWAVTAAAVARASGSLNLDPARPLQTLALNGVLPPAAGGAFTKAERNTLLFDGVATLVTVGSTVQIERMITTAQNDSFGNPTDAQLDLNTLATTWRFNRKLATMVATKFPRAKLGDDGQPFGAGQAIVTPSIMRGEILAEYSAMARLGWVENADAFAENLIVERDESNPNRMNAFIPPDYVNQFRIFAAVNQYRLQYPAA
jgi:phage tail sheath gpL-like